MQTLLRTPLHDRHAALGARLVPFAGWEMPVQYEGVIPEHRAVRTDAGVFDVSHMGELEVEGPTREGAAPGAALERPREDRSRRGAVHAPDERARRDHRRPDRLRARADALPADRQRVEPRGRLRLAQGARDPRLRGERPLERLRAARGAGAEGVRAARAPAGQEGVHLGDVGGRRGRGDGQPHRLHRRGGLRAARDGRGRGRAVGRRARARRRAVRARRARHPAARGLLPAARKRHHAGDATRSPQVSVGRARSTRTSRAPTCCAGSRPTGRSASSSPS